MNVFAVDRRPKACARALDDKRLNKMILETTQILCTVINLECGEQVTPYKNSHVHHPLVRWAEPRYWPWLYQLGVAYGKEIDYRHSRDRPHACLEVLHSLYEQVDVLRGNHRWVKEGDFLNCARNTKLGLDYTGMADTTQAYRYYLRQRWKLDKREPVWTRRGPPEWYK